jgi:hypothetical protein
MSSSSYDVPIDLPQPPFPAAFTTIKIVPTIGTKISHAAQFFSQLRTLRYPIAFELIATPESAYFQIACAPADREPIERQIAIHFPTFAALPTDMPLQFSAPTYALALVPRQEMIALKSFTQASVDPYQQLFALLAADAAASSCIQIMAYPLAAEAWHIAQDYLNRYEVVPESFHRQPEIAALLARRKSLVSNIGQDVIDFIERGGDREYYQQERRRLKEAQELDGEIAQLIKVETQRMRAALSDRSAWLTGKQPPWLVAIELYSTNRELLKAIESGFVRQYETMHRYWREGDVYAVSAIQRQKQFSDTWTLLSADELAAFAHFPNGDFGFDRLETANMKTKLPPDLFTTGEVQLGESQARGITKPVTLPDSIRDRHLYIVGKSGTGKSTLITNLALQDIQRGAGVCVIDPHGDLVEDLLKYIPQERVTDTIYLEAKDEAHPVTLDVLNAKTSQEFALLASDLQTTFRRQSETWGEKMDNLLRYTLHTLVQTEGATFFDISRILQNEPYRKEVVSKLTFPPLVDFWQNSFAAHKEAIAPIITRMGKFVLSPLYGMLKAPRGRLNLFDVIQNKKILLVNLKEIGEQEAQLLGSILVSQLQLAVTRRASIPKLERHPYYLYVDEFQNFTTSAFEKILSEARKYQLCLTFAHQFISQLTESQRDAIFGNVGTMIMFGVGDKDANSLRSQLGSFEPTDLFNLPPYTALCRPATKAADTFCFTTLAPPKQQQNFAEDIITHTRTAYTEGEPTEQAAATTPPPPAPQPPPVTPVPSAPKTRKEKILYYLSLAAYLSNQQIIELCFADLATEGSKKKSASVALSELEAAGKLGSMVFEKEKIVFVSKKPNVTKHNLAVRDLFVKIAKSDLEIISAKFYSELNQAGLLNPDLEIYFAGEDGSIRTFWEYDAGTEGNKELLTKVARYLPYRDTARVAFIFDSPARLNSFRKVANDDFITYAVLHDFTTLHDTAFLPPLAAARAATPQDEEQNKKRPYL